MSATVDEIRAALTARHYAACQRIHQLTTGRKDITNIDWLELKDARAGERLAAADLFELNSVEGTFHRVQEAKKT